MKTAYLVNTDSDGGLATDGNDLVVKLVDEKNALLAEYVFKQEQLKSGGTLYYTANTCRCYFHRYDKKNNMIEIRPNEKMEIVSVN